MLYDKRVDGHFDCNGNVLDSQSSKVIKPVKQRRDLTRTMDFLMDKQVTPMFDRFNRFSQ